MTTLATGAFEIRGESARLKIDVLGYERAVPEPFGPDWLRCEVHCSLPGFSANVPLSMAADDFTRFAASPRSALDALAGSAVLETIEERLHLVLSFHPSGAVDATGHIRNKGGPTAQMAFSFHTDQSYLAATLRQLEDVIAAFPDRPTGVANRETRTPPKFG